jgi:hypothetical protein
MGNKHKNYHKSGMLEHTWRSQRQENFKFKVSLGYIGRPCLKTKQNKKMKNKTIYTIINVSYHMYLHVLVNVFITNIVIIIVNTT